MVLEHPQVTTHSCSQFLIDCWLLNPETRQKTFGRNHPGLPPQASIPIVAQWGPRVFGLSCLQMSCLQMAFRQPKARPKKPGGHCPPGSMFQFHSVHSLFFSWGTSWSVAISIRWPPLSWSSSRSGSADGLSFLLSSPMQACAQLEQWQSSYLAY